MDINWVPDPHVLELAWTMREGKLIYKNNSLNEVQYTIDSPFKPTQERVLVWHLLRHPEEQEDRPIH